MSRIVPVLLLVFLLTTNSHSVWGWESDSSFIKNVQSQIDTVKLWIESKEYEQASRELHRLEKEVVNNLGAEHKLLAEVYRQRGNMYEFKGNYRQAWTAFEKALRMYEKQQPPDSSNMAVCLILVGRMVGFAGEYEEAIGWYEKSLELSLEIFGDNHPNVSSAYMNIGVNYENRGDYRQALDYYHKSLQIRINANGKNHALVGDALHNIGNSHYYLGEYDKAWDYYQQSLAIWQKSLGNTHPRIAYSYLSLAIIQAEKKNYQKSLEYFDKELKIKQMNFDPLHPDLAYSYNNVGLLYFRMKEYEKSLSSYEKALKICRHAFGEKHPYLAQTYANFAELYRQQEKLDQALLYNQRALIATHKHFDQEDLHANPSVEGGMDNRQLMRFLKDKADLYRLRYLKFSHDISDLSLALEVYELASHLIDEMRKSYRAEDSKLFLQQNALPVYEGGIQTAWALYQQKGEEEYMHRAFALSEKSKSTLLLSSLNELKAREFARIPPQLLDRLQDLRSELSFYEQQSERATDSISKVKFQASYFQLKLSYDSLISALETSNPQYYQLKFESQVAGIQDIQQALPDDSPGLLIYFTGDSSLFAFLIDKNGSQFLSLGNVDNLEKEVYELRKYIYAYFLSSEKTDSLYHAYATNYDHYAWSLYNRLVKPIEANQAGLNKRWVIIPDGVLGYLPFETLLQEPPQVAMNYKNYQFLIRDFQISYHFSASLWLNGQQELRQAVKNSRLLAVAPLFEQQSATFAEVEQFRREGLGPLLYNTTEAEAIHQIMGGELLIGEAATYERVQQLAPEFSVIHFATHGKVDDEDADYSFLAFASGNQASDPPRLYVRDLYNWKLPAEMVVLSACETGIGTLYKGEGIASLARAFSYAGARSIITTLWSINDAQTAEIMELFYQKLVAGKNKDEALRMAKLEYLDAQDHFHAHPFFWSAYVPIGHMAPLGSKQSSYWWLWLMGLAALAVGLWFIRNGRKIESNYD